jgi:hypothetical protein
MYQATRLRELAGRPEPGKGDAWWAWVGYIDSASRVPSDALHGGKCGRESDVAKEPTRRDDPDAIRAEMAKTRADLTEKLETLRERVLGPAVPAPNRGVQVMAVKKKAGGAAKKRGAAKKAPTKKAAAKGGAKAKRGAAKKTPASASRRSAGKKAAVTRAAGTRKAGRASAKKAPARKPARKPTTTRIVEKAKEVLGDVLVGAAGGAIQGAAQAVVPQVHQAATATEHVATAPPAETVGMGSTAAPGRPATFTTTERTTI